MDKQDIELLSAQLTLLVKEEMGREIGKMREELSGVLRNELKAFYGDMTPASHVIEHSRMSAFLGRIDDMTDGFWKWAAEKVAQAILVTAVTYYAYTKMDGTHQ